MPTLNTECRSGCPTFAVKCNRHALRCTLTGSIWRPFKSSVVLRQRLSAGASSTCKSAMAKCSRLWTDCWSCKRIATNRSLPCRTLSSFGTSWLWYKRATLKWEPNIQRAPDGTLWQNATALITFVVNVVEECAAQESNKKGAENLVPNMMPNKSPNMLVLNLATTCQGKAR